MNCQLWPRRCSTACPDCSSSTSSYLDWSTHLHLCSAKFDWDLQRSLMGGLRTAERSSLYVGSTSNSTWASSTLSRARAIKTLLDLGSDGDLISQGVVSRFMTPVEPLSPALVIHPLNGSVIQSVPACSVNFKVTKSGNHTELMRLCVVETIKPQVILRFPWLCNSLYWLSVIIKSFLFIELSLCCCCAFSVKSQHPT